VAVGFDEGVTDGNGVVLPGKYVGSSVGDTVGAAEGNNEGTGVGLPAT